MYIAVTLVAAMLSGFGFVLQQHAAEQVRSGQFLRLGLIARLIHNRRWLTGLAILIVGDLLSAWTLGHLDLSVSEPLLTTSLIFALILAVPLSGQALRRTEVVGAILLTAGVTALSLTRSVRAPGESFGSFSHWRAAGLIAVIAVALVQLGRRRSGTARAALTGTAAGLFLGIADAFTRLSVQDIDGRHPLGLLVHWPGYATILASIIGLWLMQNAFNAAQLHASLPAVTAAEPAAGIVLGVVVFGDVVHVTPLLLAVQLAGITAMVGGVILVARAPVFRDLAQLPHAALERIQHPAAYLPTPHLAGPHLPAAHHSKHDEGDSPAQAVGRDGGAAGRGGEPASDEGIVESPPYEGIVDSPAPQHGEASAGLAGEPGDSHRELGDLAVGWPDAAGLPAGNGQTAGNGQPTAAATITQGVAITGGVGSVNRLDGHK